MIRILTLLFAITALMSVNVNAGVSGGVSIPETDTGDYQLVGFFDLRDRESYIQITNTDIVAQTVHIQVFNVGNLCNENNFFDVYTPNDTHTYNLRDIVTNDGNRPVLFFHQMLTEYLSQLMLISPMTESELY